MREDQTKNQVMVVDDEFFNVEIIQHLLKKNDFISQGYTDAELALENLIANPNQYGLVILDRMMPNLNGIDFLFKLKEYKEFDNLPILMQSARPLERELETQLCGDYFAYITKPYNKKDFIQSIFELLERASLSAEKQSSNDEQSEQVSYRFQLQRHHEVSAVLTSIFTLFPNIEHISSIVEGLIFNAIEHGNLEIGFRLKTTLLELNNFEAEVERRQNNPKYANRKVNIHLQTFQKRYEITIEDNGDGFDWREYFSPQELMPKENIAIQYLDSGNIVKCTLVDSVIAAPTPKPTPPEGW